MKKLTRKSLDELAKIYPVLSAQEQRGYVAGTSPTGSVTGVARDCDVGDCTFFHDPNEHYIAPVIITPGGSGSYNGGGGSPSGISPTGNFSDNYYNGVNYGWLTDYINNSNSSNPTTPAMGGGGGGGGSQNHSLLNVTVFTPSNFVGYNEDDKTGCFSRCKDMLKTVNLQTSGSKNIVPMVVGQNNTVTGVSSHFQSGVNLINETLRQGKPVIVGVDHTSGNTYNEGFTDHFIVIVGIIQTPMSDGRIRTQYQFFDPAATTSQFGASPNNILTVGSDNITGTYTNASGGIKNYTVTQVRYTS